MMKQARTILSSLGKKISVLRRGSKIVLVLCAWLLVISMLLAFGL
ncbi:MAG TPA: hypothetical protein PKN85_05605 [Syntrophorhabdaceae bacterium]|nr:hypothetical protein [Syntrophorhabdaceae bacterium]HOD75135.1 hypothetical protein [Syntrophorhabdaceae bacterium]